MTKEEIQSKEYLDFLKLYLERCPEAYIWVTNYVDYCHRVDDIIDQDKPINYDFTLNTFRQAITLFTYPFFLQNFNHLGAIVYTAHDSYRDSVHMERAEETWKKAVADVIRQNASDVILMVILIVAGIEARNCAAITLREIAYKTQHV